MQVGHHGKAPHIGNVLRRLNDGAAFGLNARRAGIDIGHTDIALPTRRRTALSSLRRNRHDAAHARGPR